MATFTASMDRDANRQVTQSNESFLVSSAITFVATTTGATGQHTLFTVTGDVLVTVFGICNTDLTSGGAATISVGTANNVSGLIGVTTATGIDNDDCWLGSSPALEVQPLSDGSGISIINDGADITYNILSATITAGQIDFYCLFRPLESTANVVAT